MKRVGITELRTRTPKPGGDSLLTWEKGPAWLRPRSNLLRPAHIQTSMVEETDPLSRR